MQKQVETTASGSVEEALLRLLQTQEEQDRWLAENQQTIDRNIKHGLDELDRGEGIPETRLRSYLGKLKANE
ncbi:MAG TPA: hypothetical protein VH596_05360 [Terriglobales bacterium]